MDNNVMFKLTYGLFVLTAKDGHKDNGCIINTAAQVTSAPLRIIITVNKDNFTHGMIARSNEFNLSILSINAPFTLFQRFGFQSGKDVNKFSADDNARTANGILYISEYANSVISAKVVNSIDCVTHTLFLADVTQTSMLSDDPSATYQYYFDNIKPKQATSTSEGKRKSKYVCKICGYTYEGEVLPPDFICPLCKHGAVDFEVIGCVKNLSGGRRSI